MRVHLAYLAILLVLANLAHAVIITSGDGGAAFATDLSAQMCGEPNVAAVYICSGNVVAVVSSVQGEGVTFYKPDGGAVSCPEVSPAEMGAECVQLMSPNLCPLVDVCPPAGGTASPPVSPLQQPQPPAQPQKNQSANNTQQAGNTTINIIPVNAQGISQREVYVFAIVIAGMVLLALIHYYYLKKQSTDSGQE